MGTVPVPTGSQLTTAGSPAGKVRKMRRLTIAYLYVVPHSALRTAHVASHVIVTLSQTQHTLTEFRPLSSLVDDSEFGLREIHRGPLWLNYEQKPGEI